MSTHTNLFDIAGRTAFVTGSSRGLGNALATGLADAGAHVILHGRGGTVLEDAAARLRETASGRISTVTFDVTNAAETREAVTQLIAEHGCPDILVNNAGLQRRSPITEFEVDDWDKVIATNLSSAFYVTQPVARAMSERGSGKIINIGSVQSMLARQTIAPYSASKGGIVMFTKGLAADLARFNIQVNAISPGYFATEMNRDLWTDEAFNAWVVNRTPAQRWGNFEELVGTLVFLASDASAFVSGQNIFVDGGMTSVV